MLDKLLEKLSLSPLYILIAIIILCVTCIIITLIIQREKTKRTKLLTDKVSPSKKDDIIEKQLEEELSSKSENDRNIIDLQKLLKS